MKTAVLILLLLFLGISYAQEVKHVPQVSVTGESNIKVVPDQATIIATVETKGNVAKDVKKENDKQIEGVLNIIKK